MPHTFSNQRRTLRALLGWCVSPGCDEPAAPGNLMCEPHRDAHRDAARTHAAKRREQLKQLNAEAERLLARKDP